MVRGFVVSWIHYILHCTGQNLKIDLNASQNKLLVGPQNHSSDQFCDPQSGCHCHKAT